jgi:hypothetical protein
MFLHNKLGLISRIVHIVVNRSKPMLLILLRHANAQRNPGHLYGPSWCHAML